MTRQRTMISFLVMARSLSTQMSSGSPSPRFAPGASPRTRSSQYVRGTKPYKVGCCAEKRCGRSTRRYPEILSTSYFIRSNGVISMKALSTCGGSGPTSRPCQGWGRKRITRLPDAGHHRTYGRSFERLTRPQQHRGRDGEAKRARGPDIEGEIE